jgi:hypothetical protein
VRGGVVELGWVGRLFGGLLTAGMLCLRGNRARGEF